MERAYDQAIRDLNDENRSKSSEELLDPIHEFLTICYHLREWVSKDSKVNIITRHNIPKFEGTGAPVCFLICRDLCNKSKHTKLTPERRPNDLYTRIERRGNSIFRIKKSELEDTQETKERIHLTERDEIFLGKFYIPFKGTNYDLEGVIRNCMYEWKQFFEKNDLLIPRRTPH